MQEYEWWIGTPTGQSEIARMKGESAQHPLMSNVPGRRVNVCGRAGDLLVWDVYTPHGSCTNTSTEPRLALFVGLTPARPDDPEAVAAQQWGSPAARAALVA